MCVHRFYTHTCIHISLKKTDLTKPLTYTYLKTRRELVEPR